MRLRLGPGFLPAARAMSFVQFMQYLSPTLGFRKYVAQVFSHVGHTSDHLASLEAFFLAAALLVAHTAKAVRAAIWRGSVHPGGWPISVV
ncbi:MAG: hypothetical protein O3A57_09770 [Bacteroidetes bacterium]|nr:hypothetical protein [Bacteroidota bacterium]